MNMPPQWETNEPTSDQMLFSPEITVDIRAEYEEVFALAKLTIDEESQKPPEEQNYFVSSWAAKVAKEMSIEIALLNENVLPQDVLSAAGFIMPGTVYLFANKRTIGLPYTKPEGDEDAKPFTNVAEFHILDVEASKRIHLLSIAAEELEKMVLHFEAEEWKPDMVLGFTLKNVSILAKRFGFTVTELDLAAQLPHSIPLRKAVDELQQKLEQDYPESAKPSTDEYRYMCTMDYHELKKALPSIQKDAAVLKRRLIARQERQTKMEQGQ